MRACIPNEGKSALKHPLDKDKESFLRLKRKIQGKNPACNKNVKETVLRQASALSLEMGTARETTRGSITSDCFCK